VPHLDPDRLMLLALREHTPDAQDADHLDGCNSCQTELRATREVVDLGRRGKDLRDLRPPSPALWDRIAAEAFDAPAPTVVGRLPWPRRRTALAAAAALVVGILGGVFGGGIADQLLQGDRQSEPLSPRVVAQADLAPPAGAPTGPHGTARVIDTGHGLQLTVAVDDLPAATTGYYAVWLYDGHDVMIPLGSPGPGPLNLPAAARDLDVFSIVDVSAQDLGQQQHGRSVLQGFLRR
jgi:hypothetical protein